MRDVPPPHPGQVGNIAERKIIEQEWEHPILVRIVPLEHETAVAHGACQLAGASSGSRQPRR
jgi:hypothetical protein